MSRNATARADDPVLRTTGLGPSVEGRGREPIGIPVSPPIRPITVVRSQRERAHSEGLPRVEGVIQRPAKPDYRARALALWPRLDGKKLRRTRGEVARIARLVERRTALPFETIVGMLTRRD
jgi:hypothetical protein